MTDTFTRNIYSKTMNIDLSKNAGDNETMATLCSDIFTIICRMKKQQDLGTPESLRKLLKEYLRIFETNCRAIHVDSSIIESTRYALVALIDETVLSMPGQCAEFWMTNPLQFELCGDILAGEKFYDYLDKLLQNPEKNYDAIEIYFLCLSLGFSGKYIDDQEEREKFIYMVAKTLVKVRKAMTPRQKRHAVTPLKSRSSFLIPVWAVFAVSLMIIMIGWSLACFSTNHHSKTVIQKIESSF